MDKNRFLIEVHVYTKLLILTSYSKTFYSHYNHDVRGIQYE